MNVVQSYELWYDGAGMHEIRAAAGSQLLGRLAETNTNKRVAEFILRAVDYAGQAQKTVNAFKAQNHEITSTRTLDYITHIHAQCKEEIESKWGEYLSADEVNEILFEDTLQKELEKIKPKNTDIEIKLL